LKTSFWVQKGLLESWFKPGLDLRWAFFQIPHKFLSICVQIKTLK
jgi:hypothetical protein